MIDQNQNNESGIKELFNLTRLVLKIFEAQKPTEELQKLTQAKCWPIMAKEILSNLKEYEYDREFGYTFKEEIRKKYETKIGGKKETRKAIAKNAYLEAEKKLEKAGIIERKKNGKSYNVTGINEYKLEIIKIWLGLWNKGAMVDKELALRVNYFSITGIPGEKKHELLELLFTVYGGLKLKTLEKRELDQNITFKVLRIVKTETDKYRTKKNYQLRILHGIYQEISIREGILERGPEKEVKLLNDYNERKDGYTSIYNFMDEILTKKPELQKKKSIVVIEYMKSIFGIRNMDNYMKHGQYYYNNENINGLVRKYPLLERDKDKLLMEGIVGITKEPNSMFIMANERFNSNEIVKEAKPAGIAWLDRDIINAVLEENEILGPIGYQKVNMTEKMKSGLQKYLESLKKAIPKEKKKIEEIQKELREEEKNLGHKAKRLEEINYQIQEEEIEETPDELYFDELQYRMYYIKKEGKVQAVTVMNYNRLNVLVKKGIGISVKKGKMFDMEEIIKGNMEEIVEILEKI